MLPTEPPLSLHRLLAPVPPARAQDTATATRHSPPATTPAPARPPALERLLAAGQNQVGNAAVAGAAARTSPDAYPGSMLPVPRTPPLPQPHRVQSVMSS
ncbi:hypothetical protein ACFT5C_21850 [Streptomyces sp. NPDC057116]|uniref:hypothetical protein n=1 Tax=Streptomyces sp. NPDC057116 TaxID=3346023 RepID=UPI003635C8F2